VTEVDTAAVFERQRRALTGLAYRMLASRAEAEDVVQDAFLRWSGRQEADVDDPRRYLAAIVTRLCLDRMKSARARREIYVGPWLPEPVVDEAFADPGDLADDVSVALMLALERLSPLERAAFILHDVFGLSFREVAKSLDRGEAACRQLAARARARIRQARPRFDASAEEGRRLAEAFQRAAELGDFQALERLLTEDAVLISDGGGRRPAALRPIEGAQAVASLLESLSRRNAGLRAAIARQATVNGQPGLILKEPDGALTTVALEHRGGRISAVYVMRNPEKLGRVRF
jgi:RNA polymerase sigma-70 factor (ECF subfamily)